MYELAGRLIDAPAEIPLNIRQNTESIHILYRNRVVLGPASFLRRPHALTFGSSVRSVSVCVRKR